MIMKNVPCTSSTSGSICCRDVNILTSCIWIICAERGTRPRGGFVNALNLNFLPSGSWDSAGIITPQWLYTACTHCWWLCFQGLQCYTLFEYICLCWELWAERREWELEEEKQHEERSDSGSWLYLGLNSTPGLLPQCPNLFPTHSSPLIYF